MEKRKLKELLIRTWKDGRNQYNDKKGSIDYDADLETYFEIIEDEINELCAGNPTNSKPANCAIFDISKRYRFTMQDVDTNEIIIIDEDTERKAFRKAFRFFGEKKLRDRELSIVSKVDNVC